MDGKVNCPNLNGLDAISEWGYCKYKYIEFVLLHSIKVGSTLLNKERCFLLFCQVQKNDQNNFQIIAFNKKT